MCYIENRYRVFILYVKFKFYSLKCLVWELGNF